MDFKDSIKQLCERVDSIKENLQTEEATKNALIMPFINALGYDVFNPLEVVPEMTCDIGTKKGEKIDYAILSDGNPIILIECKHWKQDLNLHDNQLIRYFNVSNAKFGVLTNGIVYKFFTDLQEPNKMDSKPFLEVNLSNIKDSQIEELKKFHKSYFDLNTILSSANELKYIGAIKNIIQEEFANPSSDFVRFLGKRVYEGAFRESVIEQFIPLVKRSLSSFISDNISDRLKVAINVESTTQNNIQSIEDEKEESNGVEIITTEEEIEAYHIIKSILRTTVKAERVTMRDAATYCPIFLDNNNRKTICQLKFNNLANKRIVLFDEKKNKIEFPINDLNEIYNLSDELIEVVKRFL